jgi:hypothetical protein
MKSFGDCRDAGTLLGSSSVAGRGPLDFRLIYEHTCDLRTPRLPEQTRRESAGSLGNGLWRYLVGGLRVDGPLHFWREYEPPTNRTALGRLLGISRTRR